MILKNIETNLDINKFGHKQIPIVYCGFNKKTTQYEAYFQNIDSQYLFISEFVVAMYIKITAFIKDFWTNYKL